MISPNHASFALRSRLLLVSGLLLACLLSGLVLRLREKSVSATALKATASASSPSASLPNL